MAIALSNRALAYNNKGDYDRAIADLTRAMEVDPSYTIALGNRGFVYNNMGEYDRAIADLTRAIELDPTSCCPLRAPRRGLYEDRKARSCARRFDQGA